MRSGKYEQSSAVLKDDAGKYCCLGVLCDISNVVSWEKKNGISAYFYDGNTELLPYCVMDWSGIKSNQGDLALNMFFENDEKGYSSLIEMNDEGGASFKKIADLIEKHWKSL